MATAVFDVGYSWFDVQTQLAPDGKGFLPVAEVLNQINAPIQDGPATPSNAMIAHRTTMQTALPTVSLGKMDQGIASSKGTTEQRTEAMALFQAKNQIDNKYRKVLGPKFDEFRFRKDRPFIEAMSQKVALHLAYGEQGAQLDEGSFDGFAIRTAALQQPAPGVNGSQVWSKGAVVGGDSTSAFIVDWNADMGVHFIYPENDPSGGLDVKSYEDVNLNDKDGNQYFGTVTEFYWAIGVAVEDPRRLARLANIDVSDANLGGMNTQGNLITGLVDILSYMPDPMGFNRCIYLHGRLIAAWWKQLMDKAAPQQITREEYLGKPTLHFDGIPLRRLDQLSLAESTVS